MSSPVDFDDLLFVEGAVAGAAAWIGGYVLTAVVVLARMEGSDLRELSNNTGDGGSAIDFVGWVFFNSHFVDTVITGDVLGFGGSSTTTFIGGDGFTPLLYLVPVALLVGSGLAIGRLQGVTEAVDGVVAGALVVPAYLVLSAAGAVLFRVSTTGFGANFSGQPELLPAIVLAGVVFPAVFGAIGGIVAAVSAPDR